MLLVFKSHQPSKRRKEIMAFFKKNPYPQDSKVHKWAESKGIDPDEIETEIYSLLSDILSGGKPEAKNPNPKELKMGIAVEMEHTDCPLVAERVAKQHLGEISDYYSRLKKMEQGGK